MEDPRKMAALVSADLLADCSSDEEVMVVENTTMLAIVGAGRPVLHQIRPAAARFVHETDLHAVPDTPPRLLRSPWLVEVRRPETGEVLWGDTVGLGGYPAGDGLLCLVGMRYPSREGLAATWRPRWTGEQLGAGPARDSSPLLDDLRGRQLAWVREAARFAILLGLLLDAEGVPFRVDVDRPGRGRRGRAAADPREWTVRHIFLDEHRVSHGSGPTGGAADLDGRRAEQVSVRGHLKRQRHGPARAQVRWIYVAGYEARRWVAPRPVRVVVHADRC